jgi:hypothetical protein
MLCFNKIGGNDRLLNFNLQNLGPFSRVGVESNGIDCMDGQTVCNDFLKVLNRCDNLLYSVV